MSQIETVAGTVISIAAEQPITFDQAGYEDTGMDWVVIGEVTDLGESGREYAIVTHMPIASRDVEKHKSSRNEGQMTVQMALDEDDAGQVVVNAALDSDDAYSFRIVAKGGDAYYFQGKVSSFKRAFGTVDSMRNATMVIEKIANGGVGTVVVAA